MKLILLAVTFGVFLHSGVIVDSKGKVEYFIDCPDSDSCHVEISLNKGNHLYLKSNTSDTITLLVGDSSIHELGKQTLVFK